MPGKKYKRSPIRRSKRPGKKRGGSSYVVSKRKPGMFGLAKSPFPLSRTCVVNHRYVDYVALNPGAADAADHYFSCNNIYDCDITGVGHSAMLTDQISTLYGRWMCIGSKITVVAPGATAVGTVPVMIIHKDFDTTATADPKSIVERQRKGTAWKYVKNDGTYTQLKLGFSLRKDFGVKDYGDVQHSYSSAAAASPTKQLYYGITYGDFLGTDLGSMNVAVIIDYTVIWSEPIDVTAS